MLNNLKLGSTTSTTLLTSADTNITTGTTLPQVNAGGNPAIGNYYDQPVIDALLSGDASYDAGKPNSAETNINSANFAGYYYNWCAVMAGQGTACTQYNIYPTTTNGDICPAGWRLPTGDTTGEFAVLSSAMTTNSGNSDYQNFQFTGPFRGVFSGDRGGSSWSGQGLYGVFWSGVFNPSNSLGAFALSFDLSDVNPGTDSALRGSRFSVRCLAQTTPVTNTYDHKPTVTVDGAAVDPDDIEVISDTELRIKMPPHPAGRVDVVITLGASSQTVQYEYLTDSTPTDPINPTTPTIPGAPNTGVRY